MKTLKNIEKGLDLFVKIANAIVTIAAAIETIKPIINETIVPLIKECKDYSESLNDKDSEDNEEESDVKFIDSK